MGQGDITQKETSKRRKWAQLPQTKDRAREGRTNRRGITSKRV